MTLVYTRCTKCGRNIELDDCRDFGFCIYCGTKMTLDGIPQNNTPSPSPTGVPEWGPSAYCISVTIRFPEKPIKKGRFSYFGTNIDGRSMDIAKLGGSIIAETTAGVHDIEVRQMAYGHTCSTTMELARGDILEVQVVDEKLTIVKANIQSNSIGY